MSAPRDVSVVIATLDRAASLARCLDALFAGGDQPREVIVADQSQGHESLHVVRERAARGWPIVHHALSGPGAARARNAAARRASGAILAFTDDDCVPQPGWLGALVDAFDGPAGPAASTGRVLPLGEPEPGRYAVATRASRATAEFRGRALPWRAGTGGNLAVGRAWFERVGGWDERLGPGSGGLAGEDVDLIRRLLRARGIVRYVPEAVVLHERHDERSYRRSRWTYGFGLGAAAGCWLREGDRLGALLLAAWAAERTRLLAGALVRRRWTAARSDARMILGAIAGLPHGLALPAATGPAGRGPAAAEPPAAVRPGPGERG
ncbi:MAG TPA: glycosyltransferase [Candidatus Limnocylindrales bacterium]